MALFIRFVEIRHYEGTWRGEDVGRWIGNGVLGEMFVVRFGIGGRFVGQKMVDDLGDTKNAINSEALRKLEQWN